MKKILVCLIIGIFVIGFSACVTKEDHTNWEDIEITKEIEDAVHQAIFDLADVDSYSDRFCVVAEEHKTFGAKRKDDMVMVYVVNYMTAMESYSKPEKVSDMYEFYGSWSNRLNILFDVSDGQYICVKVDEGEDGEGYERSFKERFPDKIISEVERYIDKLYENDSKERTDVENSLNKQIEDYINSLD